MHFLSIFNLRPELSHPLFVHFPIAFTVCTFVFFAVTLISKNEWCEKASRIFLYGALLSLGFALFTGDFAEDVVKSKLCSLQMFEEHEEHAYQTLYILLAALLVDLGILWSKKKKESITMYLRGLLFLVLLAANGSLILTAHHGAELVYEQGAAVNNVTLDCSKVKQHIESEPGHHHDHHEAKDHDEHHHDD